MKSSNPMTAHESASFLSFNSSFLPSLLTNFNLYQQDKAKNYKIRREEDQNHEIIKQKHHPSIHPSMS